MTATIIAEIELPDRYIDIDLIFDVIKEEHRGHERFWLYGVDWNKSLFTEQENEIIYNHAYSDNFFDKFMQTLKNEVNEI